MVHVAITGLRLRRPWYALAFWGHAVASMGQAQAAEGCLSAQARTINGVQHTLSVWRDRAAMLAYVRSGAHRAAMRAFPKIAVGEVISFEAERAPSWEEARAIWEARGEPRDGRAWLAQPSV